VVQKSKATFFYRKPGKRWGKEIFLAKGIFIILLLIICYIQNTITESKCQNLGKAQGYTENAERMDNHGQRPYSLKTPKRNIYEDPANTLWCVKT